MPVTPTYPGVYIQEIPSGVRTITGVATSITAFVDFFPRGRMNQAVQIFSFADFQREFGGLDQRSEASFAIQQFYLNGGSEAWVVRVASGNPAQASVLISNAISGSAALTVTARDAGVWGDNLRLTIDHQTASADLYNLKVSEFNPTSGRIAREEQWLNLSTSSASNNPRFGETVINDANRGSQLIRVTTNAANRPLANGTFSGVHAANPVIPASPTIDISIGSVTVTGVQVTLAAGATALANVAPALEAAIRSANPANSAFSAATVRVVGAQLHILAGATDPDNIVTFANGASTLAGVLKLRTADGAVANLQAYTLGSGAVASTAQVAGGVAGNDGSEPNANALIGVQVNKTGMYALEDVDLFNILCIPRTGMVGTTSTNPISANDAFAVMSAAQTYCESRRAFYIVDAPEGFNTPTAIRNWLDSSTGAPRHRNLALFYPRTRVPNPLDEYRLRSIGPSGTLAGLFSRTDSARGVWKAPAGTEASLRNVAEFDYNLTDAENGSLNPLAINCLRTFPVYGNIVWGSRTLDGADARASEWKYIPVRRLALFLEESLFRGTQWVVFEPNDEPLWAQIRLNIGAFMHNLFRQGAFQGTTPQQAYFVKCDSETTTQTDINNGIVNIIVGFAPLRPAEFVIISIQQIAQTSES